MKIAYLVFAYKNPVLLEQTIARLATEGTTFFIHIDRKVDVNQFSNIKGPNIVFLTDRVTVFWAEFSGVEAILRLINRAAEAPEKYDYCVLLSGSEYPLRSGRYIEEFFDRNKGGEFIDMVSMPNAAAGRTLVHLNTLWIPSHRPLLRFLVKVANRCGLIRRQFARAFPDLTPFGGHTWWALSMDACRLILETVRTQAGLVEFFRYSPQPEETFFHTILGNSNFLSRVRRSVLFEDWSAGGVRPEMISSAHLDYFDSEGPVLLNDVFGRGEALVARKFGDETLDLLPRLNAIIDKKDGLAL
jgi:hypothetical protein